MDLFAPHPTDNLLPFDGIVNDFGIIIENPTALYQTLLDNLPWQSDKVTVYGKTYITERQVVWMGDENADYSYSGHTHISIPWTAEVWDVKQKIEFLLKEQGIEITFNSCLLNYYPTGNSGMGYHADDEPELGFEPLIAALSLGETRKFVFKHNRTKENVELFPENGELIVMRGSTQDHWKHTITKTTKSNQGRISLTFRYIYPSGLIL